MDTKTTETSHWVRRFPAPEDSGYLLFSGVDPQAKQSIVKLIRISDGITLAHWTPDWPTIFAQHTSKKFAPEDSAKTAQTMHPLLMSDGDIVFNTTGKSLVRLGPCSGQPIWVLENSAHHSIEMDADGTLWVPSVSQVGLADNPWLRDRVRDDALAHISKDGQLIEKLSFIKILRDNNQLGLLLGTAGARINEDPIHLNQIQVAAQDSKYWKCGDLLISARHLSTIFLYRPSTGKILWQQTGPWLNQHSADFVGDHQISVFDNNSVAYADKEHAFIAPNDTNRVLVFDFSTGNTSQPFAALLAKTQPRALTGGRARVLPDGGLFLEETDAGRHLRFTRDRLLWSRVNDYDDKRIGLLMWSRYLTAEEARAPLQALAARRCSATTRAVKTEDSIE
jgi:WD40 repeat protein